MKGITHAMKERNPIFGLATCSFLFGLVPAPSVGLENPFLPPGAKSARSSQPIIRPAPPAPKPKPINPNLELRGIFRYRDVWHFSIHDKVKNKGYWVTSGDALSEAGVEVESFDEKNDVLKLKGGMTLALKKSMNKTLPVPGQGKPKPIAKKPTSPRPSLPSPRRVTLPSKSGVRRTVTIPPRLPNAAPKPTTTSGGRVRVVGKKP